MTAKMVSTSSILLLGLVAGTTARVYGQETSIVSRIGKGMSFFVVALNKPVSLENVMPLTSQLNTSPVTIIRVYSSEHSNTMQLSGKGSLNVNRTDWYKQYKSGLGLKQSVAELIRVGRNTAVRVRTDTTIQSRIIAGSDPLDCSRLASGCEILWISVGSTPPLLKAKTSDFRVHLFMKVKELPSLERARTISEELSTLFATSILWTSFRQDEWFIDESDFPVVYPFSPWKASVSLGEIDEKREVSCGSIGNGFGCYH